MEMYRKYKARQDHVIKILRYTFKKINQLPFQGVTLIKSLERNWILELMSGQI